MKMIRRVLALSLLLSGCILVDAEWDGRFDSQVARPEHPRPDFRRDSYINLNTRWEFAYDSDDKGIEERWFAADDVFTHKIQVPYAWEAPLSGLVPPHAGEYSIGGTLKASTHRGVAWYRLRLPAPLPDRTDYDWHLVFGAVDFKSTVWINGKQALTHVGGYDPFSVNLAKFAKPGDKVTIVVRVEDYTELNRRAQPVGKQGGVWYTRTSGIWQTVYLEQRPAVYVTGLHLVPEPAQKRVRIRLTLSRPATGMATFEAGLPETDSTSQFAGGVTAPFQVTSVVDAVLALDPIRLWDAASPHLYDLRIQLAGEGAKPDTVESYFGLVTVKTDWLPGRSPFAATHPAEQAKAIFVNGRPRYLRCVLDQAYYPDGIYTAAGLDDIRRDLEIARSFGFNCIRQHIKSDEPVKYRLFDEMGFYVVYDIVALDMLAANAPGFPGRQYFADNLVATMTRDRNHPSIIAWTVFNENWGLIENGDPVSPTLLAESASLRRWVLEMVELARGLDPTRPLEDNSAGGMVRAFEHLTGDLNSFHYYGSDAAEFREFLAAEERATYPGSTRNYVGGQVQDGAPWWNSEFASFSAVGEPDAAYCDLFGLVNEMRRLPKLVGWVLTQLTDVEFEANGLVTYDRQPKADLCSREGVGLVDVFGDDFVAFDWLPYQPVTAGTTVGVPLRFSHWSGLKDETLTVRLAWAGGGAGATLRFVSEVFDVKAIEVELTMPSKAGVDVLVAEVLDSNGDRLAANRLQVVVQ